MTTYNEPHLEVIATMYRAGVIKSHHKQKTTIKGWCNGFDGDVLDSAISDLKKDPSAPLMEKGRGTITLTGGPEAEEFIKEHDTEDEYIWFVD